MRKQSHLKRIARLGGAARIQKHGNPGTVSGRSLGGLRSIRSHALFESNFNTLKKIRHPRPSRKLAEMLGIFMGDGYVGIFQASIVTNSRTDFAHALYAKQLLEQLFRVKVAIRTRKDKEACELVVSSKSLCNFLFKQGMTTNKVKKGVSIPSWILSSRPYSTSFLKGLFDTDGCVFLDTHRYKNKIYRNVGLAFSNRNPELINFFKSRIESLGLSPTQNAAHAVFLRRRADIADYFRIVGTSNAKHRYRFNQYISHKSGGVA